MVMTTKCMSTKRFNEMMKSYNLVKSLVTKFGTKKTAEKLTKAGLNITAEELESFKE